MSPPAMADWKRPQHPTSQKTRPTQHTRMIKGLDNHCVNDRQIAYFSVFLLCIDPSVDPYNVGWSTERKTHRLVG